jgi:hypothetical protein
MASCCQTLSLAIGAIEQPFTFDLITSACSCAAWVPIFQPRALKCYLQGISKVNFKIKNIVNENACGLLHPEDMTRIKRCIILSSVVERKN